MNVNLSKIIELINNEKYSEAEEELKPIYEKNLDNFDVIKLCGMVVLAQKKYKPALKFFNKCLEIKENDYDINVNLSYLFTKIQLYDLAIKYGEIASELNNQRPHSFHNLAESYFHLGDYDKAELLALQSIEKRGGLNSLDFIDTRDLVALYSDILLAKQKNDSFITFAKKILEEHYSSALLLRLLRLKKDLIEKKYLLMAKEALIRFEKIPNLVDRNTNKSNTYFFLAEYYSKEDISKSEEYYIVANQLIADMQRESLFNRQKIANNILDLFSNYNFDHIENEIPRKKGEGLIFIFGMPRSGTTLTESILCTAENIQAGGEKVFFSIQNYKVIDNLPASADNLDIKYFKELGDNYLESIKLHRKDNFFFVDKLPENYLFYKFIKLSLPGAKFIHCYRDPWDNAISLFKQNYSTNIFYASSFFGIATEYANYEALIKFWKKSESGDTFLEIRYENIIKDRENFIKIIWDFCGLKGAYSEEKRKRHVGVTASMQQVTRDIYNTSIKKQDFIAYKDKFLEDLESQRGFWKQKGIH